LKDPIGAILGGELGAIVRRLAELRPGGGDEPLDVRGPSEPRSADLPGGEFAAGHQPAHRASVEATILAGHER
jgi:hypothetical protein